MKNNTIALVLVSIFLSVFSIYSVKKSWGETYPFFHYKLYSRPDAMSGEAISIGIYANNMRLNNTPATYYSTDDLTYLLNKLLQHPEENTHKLSLLLNNAYPNKGPYTLKKEIHKTKAYLEGTNHVIITPIITIN
jgi:hypothetical protein